MYLMYSKKYFPKKSANIIKKTLLLIIALPKPFQNFSKNLDEFV